MSFLAGWDHKDIIALGSLVVSVAAFIIAIFAARNGRRAIIESNRAWIAPSGLVFGDGPRTLPFTLYLKIVNVGRQPALSLSWKTRMYATKYIPEGSGLGETPTEPNTTDRDVSVSSSREGAVIWPVTSQNFLIPLRFEDTPEYRQIFEATVNRSKTMVVEGCLKYRSGGRVRKSAFRFYLRDAHGLPVDKWMFNIPLTGNFAD